MTTLAKCPCGEVPGSLLIQDAGQGGKWARVSGSCCDEWSIEFRTDYSALDSESCKALAEAAWNQALRGQMSRDICEHGELTENHCPECANLPPTQETCTWAQDDEGGDVWNTDCHQIFCLGDGGPKDNGMMFCCFCGKPLVEIPWEDREGAE